MVRKQNQSSPLLFIVSKNESLKEASPKKRFFLCFFQEYWCIVCGNNNIPKFHGIIRGLQLIFSIVCLHSNRAQPKILLRGDRFWRTATLDSISIIARNSRVVTKVPGQLTGLCYFGQGSAARARVPHINLVANKYQLYYLFFYVNKTWH